MSVVFNGTTITDPYFNGTKLDYIYFNGTLVYQRATPYYPTFTNSSLWTTATVDNAATPFKVTSSSVEVCAQDNEQMTDFSYSWAQATFNTQGCNKLRVKAKSDSGARGFTGDIIVNGVSQTVPESTSYLYYDISGDTFTIKLDVLCASSYFGTSLTLYEIYVYYE